MRRPITFFFTFIKGNEALTLPAVVASLSTAPEKRVALL